MKARRIGLSEERVEDPPGGQSDHELQPIRWQYIGINELAPLPVDHTDGGEIASFDFTSQDTPLEDLFRSCHEDCFLEDAFGEKRVGQHYRAIADSDEAGF